MYNHLPHVIEVVKRIKASTPDEMLRLNRLNEYSGANWGARLFLGKAEDLKPEILRSWIETYGLGKTTLRRIILEEENNE